MSFLFRGILVVCFLMAGLDARAQRPASTPASEEVNGEPRKPPLIRRIFGAKTPADEADAPQATPAPTPRPPRATPTPPPTQVEEEDEESRRPPLIRRIFGARTPEEDSEEESADTPKPTPAPARPRATPAARPAEKSTPAPTPASTPTPVPTPSPTPKAPVSDQAIDFIPEVNEEEAEPTPAPTPTAEEMKQIYGRAREEALTTDAVMAAKEKVDSSTTEDQHYKNSLEYYKVLFGTIEEAQPSIASHVNTMRTAAIRRLDRRRDRMKAVFEESSEISESIRREAEAPDDQPVEETVTEDGPDA